MSDAPLELGMRIALAQIDTTIGDFDGNADRIRAAMERARDAGARLLVLPELAVCGYPPLDLLERASFRRANRRTVEALAAQVPPGLAVLVGFAEPREDGAPGHGLHNAAALLADGRVQAVRRKALLPTYDVFDESRYFDPNPEPAAPVVVDGLPLGVTICEDVWNDERFWPRRRYARDPVLELIDRGARAIVNLSASPYHVGKPALRRRMLAAHATRHGVPVAWCNLVGGNDELIFEGGSLVIDAGGRVVVQAARFAEDFVVCDLFAGGDQAAGGADDPGAGDPDDIAEVAAALELGLRDYCRKTGFRRVVLGLSGGIDSAVSATLAARALGPANVTGIAMPSRYSSESSVADARALAEALGIELHVVPIEPAFAAMLEMLEPVFAGREPDVTEENIQARLRGVILMAHSNKFGGLLLTTGNKSELAVGYCTLYGDMNGGLAVISDLPKGRVYALARHYNRERTVIPESTLTKPPSAELRPGQTDQDSLPPYDVLDDVLHRYVERGDDIEAIVAAGHDEATVRRIVRMVDLNEYKRRQAAPGLKVTPKAFGIGRRLPIAQRFRHGGP